MSNARTLATVSSNVLDAVRLPATPASSAKANAILALFR